MLELLSRVARASVERRALCVSIVLVVATLLTPARQASADWIVYPDGTRLETRGEWRLDDNRVVFSLPNGQLAAVKADEVDLEASRMLTRSLEAVSLQRAALAPATRAPSRVRVASSLRTIYPLATVEARPCLHLRARPLGEAESSECIAYGTRVEILGRQGDWAQVRTLAGRRGWQAGAYLNAASSNSGEGSSMVLTDADVGHVQADLPAGVAPDSLLPDRERGLVVTKWGQSDAQEGGTTIVGYLRNLSDRVSTSITLDIRVLDQELETMLDQPAMLDTTTLGPRQVTRFEARLDRIFSFRELQFEAKSMDVETTVTTAAPSS